MNQLTALAALGGIVGCARPPVVLLYGLVHPNVSAAMLRSGGRITPFWQVGIPTVCACATF